VTARREPAQLLVSAWAMVSVALHSATLIGVALLLILVVLPAAIAAAGAAAP
jgi:hypothetical protein